MYNYTVYNSQAHMAEWIMNDILTSMLLKLIIRKENIANVRKGCYTL
jgi:hypothetical protein